MARPALADTLPSDRELARIKALVIPPAWEDVWICPHPRGHVQAVGTDAAGRRQYLYHQHWRERRGQLKFDRVMEFGRALPRVRAMVDRHLRGQGLTRDRVLAVADGQVCSVVRSLKRRRTGEHLDDLLVYRSGARWHNVTAADINDYLRETADGDFTAKDFRTWHATVLAAVGLAVSAPAADGSAAARKRAVARVVKEVSGYLGNTPAVARASYIDPRVIACYEEGVTIAPVLADLGKSTEFGDVATKGEAERAVLKMLTGSAARRRAPRGAATAPGSATPPGTPARSARGSRPVRS